MTDNVPEIVHTARTILLEEGISEVLIYLLERETAFPSSGKDELHNLVFRHRELRRADRQGHLTGDETTARTNKLQTDIQDWLRQTAAYVPTEAETSEWPPGLRDELLQHLTFAQLEMAFEKIRSRMSDIPEGERTAFRQLLIRWETFRRDKSQGTLDYATTSRISNAISADLMELL